MFIKIDNELMEVDSVNDDHYTDGVYVECEGMEYVIFKTQELAGKAAREYWVDLYENDKEEFKCLVGVDNILAWAMGEHAGPGTTKVESLSDWFDLWLDTPEEHFANYDGDECQVDFISRDLLRELEDDKDWLDSIKKRDAVAYRVN